MIRATLEEVVRVFFDKVIGYFGDSSEQVKKYLVVTVFNLLLHQIIFLFLAKNLWEWSLIEAYFGSWAEWKGNALAAVITAVPAFILSRYWAWEVKGTSSFRTEILPFWAIALLGLLVSSGFVAIADGLFDLRLLIIGASLFGYFIVWVMKFVLLNRLFTPSKNVDAKAA